MINIPDAAFEKLFAFFDSYNWHLDDRPVADGRHINPDVLGYIFEKYINQRQMGAYYTKEDITEYISKNTILPFLLERTKEKCEVAFTGKYSAWHHLSDDPDRYIPNAVRRGVELPLPANIEAGVADISIRGDWNQSALSDYALPTEIWRETVARRQRYAEVRGKMERGEVTSSSDLITLNLDIRQFVQDVVERSEGAELLRAIWKTLNGDEALGIPPLSVLDPTCGSGAFLFAAVEILQPIYMAYVARMRGFVEDANRLGRANDHKEFRSTLADVDKHPNEAYFILKKIITHNLFGVDIMEEATEICKLRLFLKLAAQVEPDETKNNLGIEPLPDIDFNIRAGNTLIGFATEQQMHNAVSGNLGFEGQKAKWDKFKADLEVYDAQFEKFLEMQERGDFTSAIAEITKRALREKLKPLRDQSDKLLGYEYGKISDNQREGWIKTAKPFHWFVEFYRTLRTTGDQKGGFDCVIGNPPYLETREVDYVPKGYASEDSAAIHAMCMERSIHLLNPKGAISMIVPLSLVSTQRMQIVQRLIEEGRNTWYANYAWRPAKLFDTVNRALTIFISFKSDGPSTYSTDYQKWASENRGTLVSTSSFSKVARNRSRFWVPKIETDVEGSILSKVTQHKGSLENLKGLSEYRLYYRTTGGLYWKVFTDFSPSFTVNGDARKSSRETSFATIDKNSAVACVAILSSSTFWWWYTVTSNLRDLNPADIFGFRFPLSSVTDANLIEKGIAYIDDIKRNSMMLQRLQKQTGKTETQSFKIQKSKPIIDQIDRVLATHYGFTEEELDFIINYDIKYRMGRGFDNGDDSEE